jgi:periplasmic protein CpxP/Spy
MTRSRIGRNTRALAVAGALAASTWGAGALFAQQTERQPAPQEGIRRPGPGQPGVFWRGPGPGPMGLMLPLRQLDLSDAQHEQVKGILDGHREALQANAEKVRAAMKAQHDAVESPQFDEAAVRDRAAALAAVQADATVLHARIYSEVFAVLTPEQQAKATELKAAREQRMSESRQRVRERVKQRQPRPQV